MLDLLIQSPPDDANGNAAADCTADDSVDGGGKRLSRLIAREPCLHVAPMALFIVANITAIGGRRKRMMVFHLSQF